MTIIMGITITMVGDTRPITTCGQPTCMCWLMRSHRFWPSPHWFWVALTNWMDPAMGIVGGLVIARWSWGLIRDTGRVLLDYIPHGEDLPDEIRAAIESEQDRITDLHIWRLGPGHHGAIISIQSDRPQTPAAYRARLHISKTSHLTVEVEGKR
ncbi:MAG: hypothetical protein R3C70_12035 [Geminicoccaceae bacterium]